MKRLLGFLAKKYRALLQIHDTPHSIAGGVAIGVFFGFTPLFGFRILIAILIAWLFRCSKVAAALAANLHEIFFFFWGFVYIFEYKIGFWILASPHRFPPKIPRHVRLADLFHWSSLNPHPLDWEAFIHIGWPWLIGSGILGLPFAGLFFALSLKLVREYQRKRMPVTYS